MASARGVCFNAGMRNSETSQSATVDAASIERLVRLLGFDQELLSAPRKNAVQILVGTDEVGRGCLAGPVVAAAVILPPIDVKSELAMQLAHLNDSKQVSPQKRALLAAILSANCRYAIGEATAAEVDRLNVLRASLLAMHRAIRKLDISAPVLIAVDGNQRIRRLAAEQVTIVDGDTYSASVAAASIIAKVYRDDLMVKLSRRHPHFGWESNKGYRSRQHWTAIHEHGMTRWHRKRFIEKWLGMPYPPPGKCEENSQVD